MAIVDEVIVESLSIHAATEQTHEEIVDAIDAFEFYQPSSDIAVVSTAAFSEAMVPEAYAHAIAVANFQSQLTYSVQAMKQLTEVARFTDREALGYAASVNAAAAFSDAFKFFPTVLAKQAAHFTSAVAPVTVTGTSITERAQFKDKIGVGLGELVNASAHFTDALALQRLATEAAVETAVFTSQAGAGSRVSSALFESAQFASVVAHNAVTHGWGVSVANFRSSVDYLDPGATAWVMTTETTAMSKYLGYDFESVAQYNGVLFGVNRDGIHILEGAKDSGLLINSLLETGYMDFDIDEKKRIPNLYVGFTMAGGVIRLTTWTRMNAAQKYHYDTPVLPYLQPVNSRFTLGKGLNHEYWKFALTNRNGAYFALDKWSADVAISARRIG